MAFQPLAARLHVLTLLLAVGEGPSAVCLFKDDAVARVHLTTLTEDV